MTESMRGKGRKEDFCPQRSHLLLAVFNYVLFLTEDVDLRALKDTESFLYGDPLMFDIEFEFITITKSKSPLATWSLKTYPEQDLKISAFLTKHEKKLPVGIFCCTSGNLYQQSDHRVGAELPGAGAYGHLNQKACPSSGCVRMQGRV